MPARRKSKDLMPMLKRIGQIGNAIRSAINREIPKSSAYEIVVGVLLTVDQFLARAPGDGAKEFDELRCAIADVMMKATIAVLSVDESEEEPDGD